MNSNPAAFLLEGQLHEAQSDFAEAILCYDAAIALVGALPLEDPETRRQLGVAWMNRGNALQKQNDSAAAVEAYDQAIALFRSLPATSAHRNHLAAAWLNRGRAFLDNDQMSAGLEPVHSFERAIALLADLPLDENPAYRLNLSGAWTNLGQTQLTDSPERAQQAARVALSLVATAALDDPAFATMSLRAQRVLVLALGERLSAAELAGEPTDGLANEAIEAVESGLAVARIWDKRDNPSLVPLALRLFRLGAQLYRLNQPRFLAEFLLENLDPEQIGSFAFDSEFRAAAEQALNAALDKFERSGPFFADAPQSANLLETVRELRAAQRRLVELSL